MQAKYTTTDKRNIKVSESVTGIKIIKFNAWEQVVKQMISVIRTSE